jgi:hypothetical protein
MGFRGCACPTYNRENLLGGEALLGLLCSKVEFQKNVDDAAIGGAPGIDSFKEVKGIHGLDQVHVREDKFQFIGLEMADKMPADIRWHLRNLGGKLLGAALGKDALTGIICFHKAFHWMELGDGHQFYPGGESGAK